MQLVVLGGSDRGGAHSGKSELAKGSKTTTQKVLL